MASFKRFEDIEGWQLARELNQRVWELISTGRFGKDFALCDQLNRSAGSTMDNVSEGFDGGSDAEFVRFLRYSQRSTCEVQSQLYRALDRSHITANEFDELHALAGHVSSKVGALIRYLSKS
ncbi:MAG: four helix bundle protein [Verrucomicrobia bacterium]|nr:four helix bundle protein [Verrucomicrobiota bacterium]